MIAAWIFELLRRERDWRAALPNIAAQLSDLPDDRVRAARDLGAAFEHLEPDRRHAITAYQLAGHGRDGGRSRVLAIEMGWWAAAGRLAYVELKASGDVDALVMTCRELLDRETPETAMRLLQAVQREPASSTDPRVMGLRAEIEGPAAEWKTWGARACDLAGVEAAGAFVTAARLARSDGQADWTSHLHAALAVHPGDVLAAAMLVDVAIATNDRKAIIDLIKVRLARLDSGSYCNALRVIAARLTRAGSPGHAGLARRLVKVALERAYADKLTEIPGHLAMWTMMDAAAAQDGRRIEQLPLLLRGLEGPTPACDRVWLAALGAAICIEAGDLDAARAYAVVVAEQAPSHPIVLDLLAATSAATDDAAVRHDLDLLERDGGTVPALESVAPDDEPILASPPTLGAAAGTYRVDPRYVDLSVPVLDDPPEPQVVTRSTATQSSVTTQSASPAASAARAASASHRLAAGASAPEPVPVASAPPALTPTTRTAAAAGPTAAPPALTPTTRTAAAAGPASAPPALTPTTRTAAAAGPASAPPALTPTTRTAAAAGPASAPANAPRSRTLSADWAQDAESSPAPAQAVTAAPVKAESSLSLAQAVTAAPVKAESSPPLAQAVTAAPTSAASSSSPAITAAPPVSSPPPTSLASGASTKVADQQALDAQLFLPRKRATQAPVSATAARTASAVSSESPKVHPPAPRAIAPVLPPINTPGRMLIPTGALAVLQSGGAPRALPKIPSLSPHAIPRAGRVGVPVDVRILHEDQTIDVHTRDISATGFFAVTSVSFVVGTLVDCELSVPISGLSEQSFSTRARIVRRDPGGYGIVFVEPPVSLVDAITALGTM